MSQRQRCSGTSYVPIPSGQARCRASMLVDFVIPFCVYHEFERNPVKVGYRNVPSVIYPAGSAAGWIGHRVSSPSPRVVAGPHVKVCKLPAIRSADPAWQNSSRMPRPHGMLAGRHLLQVTLDAPCDATNCWTARTSSEETTV